MLTTAAAAWPSAASAQSATDVLPPTREEVTRPVTQPALPQGSRLDIEGGFERSPCALDGPDFQSIRYTLRGVEFEGLKGLSPAEVEPAYSAFVGQELPIASVCEIRDRAAAILRQAGYISAVQIPEQKISDGVVRFNVLMAHLTKVQVRGDASGAEKLIAGYLNRLTEEAVFNRYQAERYLLLASDIPGYNVRLTLRPAGTVPGDVIGDVTVQRTPAYADFNLQNYGSTALGRWGGLLRGQLFGLTGLGDRTTLAVFSTSDLREQQTVQLAHDFRLGNEGLSFGGAFTYAWAKPDVGGDVDIKARTLLATIQADFPLIRKLSHNVRGTIGMDIVNQDVELDTIDLTRDRLRVAFLRLSLDALDTEFSDAAYSLGEPPWRFSGLVEIRQGLPILGATRDCGPLGASCLGVGNVPPSRLEGQSDATVVRGTMYGEFRPVPRLTLAAGARAQYAGQPLLSFEEFSAGNYTTGRGYDPGALIGDRGFGSQLEVRYGNRFPASAKAAAIEGYLFWDHSRVGNRDRLVEIDQSNHLNSVGGGARIAYDRFALDAVLAIPMTRVGLDDRKPDPRILISLTSRLWPWSYK
ncbi:MAG: ShlB/FhaC/HecB family hemolysin secretion/activation protein [Sphingomicrobium sp.]